MCRLQAEASQRLQVLLEALGVTEASLSHLLPQLRLLVAVTCYWMQRAQPRPDERLLRALLLGVTNGDALRRRAGIKHEHVLTAVDTLISGLFSVITLSDKSLWCVCVCVWQICRFRITKSWMCAWLTLLANGRRA